jgi:hypothetical protein
MRHESIGRAFALSVLLLTACETPQAAAPESRASRVGEAQVSRASITYQEAIEWCDSWFDERLSINEPDFPGWRVVLSSHDRLILMPRTGRLDGELTLLQFFRDEFPGGERHLCQFGWSHEGIDGHLHEAARVLRSAGFRLEVRPMARHQGRIEGSGASADKLIADYHVRELPFANTLEGAVGLQSRRPTIIEARLNISRTRRAD